MRNEKMTAELWMLVLLVIGGPIVALNLALKRGVPRAESPDGCGCPVDHAEAEARLAEGAEGAETDAETDAARHMRERAESAEAKIAAALDVVAVHERRAAHNDALSISEIADLAAIPSPDAYRRALTGGES